MGLIARACSPWKLVGLVLLTPVLAMAQADSVTIIAGPGYRAGNLKESLLGRDYRDLWTTPIRVAVLDLDTYAGGLTPQQRGSGLQTRSLRFLAADGREYNFRSVDKDQTGGLHPDFRNTLVDRVTQDQVSSKHPAGALITSPLLEAAGVLHAVPRLYVMPDDPRLGEFKEEFGGMLGFIEVHTNEGDDDEAGFAGAARVTDAERLLEHLEEGSEHRVAAREYLRARLMDFLVGDWDRHLGQWRWARYGREGSYWWVPIPEDRDNAFSSFDGLLLKVARGGVPHLNDYGAEYPDLMGLTNNAQILDRQLLSELPREAFDSMAVELQRRLTDEVLARGVENAPPEYVALRGEELMQKLRARRAALPEVARRFYRQLARQVDVWATDEADVAVADRLPNRSVELRLFSEDEFPDGQAYFRRRFMPGETREVRVYLRGGDDRGIVRGAAGESLLVRMIGGGSDDVLVDSSGTAGSTLTYFYDDRGDNRFHSSVSTIVDTREFNLPEVPESGFNENAPGFRDWGKQTQWFRPWAEWRYNVGPVIGGGPQITRYGFRQLPYAQRIGLLALYAPLHTRFAVEVSGDFRRTNSPNWRTLNARASQLAVTRFHGFGNETFDTLSSDAYKVWNTEFQLDATYHRRIGERGEFFMGPLARHRRPELDPSSPALEESAPGDQAHTIFGVQVGGVIDTRDLPSFPRRGYTLSTSASGFLGEGIPSAFSRADAHASTYLPLPLPLESTLALRLGGTAVFGDFVFQEAAFVGGSGTLRGFPRQRFAGDAAAYGGAELRTFLTRFHFISRGDLGIIGLADAARVFADGDSSDQWHTGYGGGIWVGILDRTRTASLVLAQGSERSLYLSFGMPF